MKIEMAVSTFYITYNRFYIVSVKSYIIVDITLPAVQERQEKINKEKFRI